MDLTPYVEALRRDLVSAAGAGAEPVREAAEVIAAALDAPARLALMEALSDAADEITGKLQSVSVEVRLRGREADLVVTELTGPEPVAPEPADGDVARITLRLPESLKAAVERAAAADGVSVNAWLVRAIGHAVSGRPGHHRPPFPPGPTRHGRRVTGFAQA
jgi:hypothetical protein